jgi:hypothetical protein
MLAWRERISLPDFEVGRWAQILAVDENSGASRIHFCLQLSHRIGGKTRHGQKQQAG